jgi:DNA-binding Lrp family transcriptional regulator
VERPYRIAAQALGIGEDELITRIGRLLEGGVLTRFGPLFDIARAGGAFTLAAMSVPAGDFERVAALVNRMPEVAHNYERDHPFNMWFVLATETPDAIPRAVKQIEEATGYFVIEMPKLDEYFIGLRLAA